jgi:hypothetical protein
VSIPIRPIWPMLALALSLVAIAACDDGPGTSGIHEDPNALVFHPLQPFPPSLSEVGLYPIHGDIHTISKRALSYTPRWPLWSSGSDKHRYLVLPEGEQIDNQVSGALDGSAWDFPVGTIFFKTFLFPDADGALRPMETRLLRRNEEEWDYVTYQWNADGQDATLLDMKAPVYADSFGPNGEPFTHEIPNRIACRKCHESSLQPVLGFTELQLAHAEQDSDRTHLESLSQTGVFTHAPPTQPAAVIHEDPATREVLGYFVGNCVHCHNGSDGPSSSFDIRPDVALDNLINHPTESSATAAGIRVVPGHPEQSVLFQGLSGETDNTEVKPMPPLGADVPDHDAIERVREWILNLEASH